ncbi:MAG TPA: hypothetical protein VGG19_19785 [Tepidisphaeraceae bacterium]
MARRGLFSKKKLAGAVNSVIEPLEMRRMLTTWTGGGVDQLGNPVFDTYDYIDGQGNTVQVNIGGNTTAEFIFYNPNTGGISDAIQAGTTGLNLFQIYVARSDINSVISVTQIDATTGAIEPFGGTAPTLNIDPNSGIIGENPPTAAGSAETGALVLGGLEGTSPYIPVVKLNAPNGGAFGVRPAGIDDLPNDPANNMSAGLVVAPGLSLGKFLFAGEVFGKVSVPGNMNLFYAGWLLTGDAAGASEGSSTISTSTGLSGLPSGTSDGGPIDLDDGLEVPRQNFYVGGDLQNLATIGPIGWDGKYGTDTDDGDPHYLSGVDIYIGGKLGAITALDGDASSVHVANNSTVPEPIEDQQELEGLNAITYTDEDGINEPTGEGDFSTGYLVQYITSGNINPFQDNNFANAQFLGAFDTSLGNNTIVVDGQYDSSPDIDRDPNDYYGIGLLAGQTINVDLVSTLDALLATSSSSTQSFAYVGIFDPDGRLVATDYDNNPNNTTNFQQPFQFTATMPGEYRIGIGSQGDVNFADFSGSSVESVSTFETYKLSITNVGNLAVGGIKTGGTSLETDAGWQKLEVDNGDVGDIDAATNYHVTFEAAVVLNASLPNNQLPTTPNVGTAGIYIADGNLRSFDCGAIGLGIGDDSTWDFIDYSAPDLDIPNGSVGLVRARTGILELNPNNMNNTGGTPALSIGGSYEWVQGASTTGEDIIVGLAAKGGIGSIIGQNMQPPGSFTSWVATTFTSKNTFSVISADTDNSGNDGIIDSIDIAGNLIGAQIFHGPGGDLRFMTVGGILETDTEYSQNNQGTNYAQSVAYDYNQPVTLTDDSGSTITLTPIGQEFNNPFYDSSITDPTNIASVPEFGPRLVVQTYPLESGGVCIVDVQSTGGLSVSTSANGVNGVAEISKIEVHTDGAVPAPTETINQQTGRISLTMPATTYSTTTYGGATGITTGTGTGTGTTTTSTNVVTVNTTNTLDVTISGSARTDIANIVAEVPNNALGTFDFPITNPIVTGALDNITEIDNTTGGDIISVEAASAGEITTGGRIGLAVSRAIPGMTMQIDTGFATVATLGTALANAYPFLNQTFGINVSSDIYSISAGEGVGNIVSDGYIQQINADSGGNNSNKTGVFAGIDGPIVAANLNNVNIGQGILFGGTGSVSFAGLYAVNYIGSVTNQGQGSDVRGNIISSGTIGSITLNNGALIGAEVGIISNWVSTQQNAPQTVIVPIVSFSTSRPLYQVGNIAVTGTGGIIGSQVIANSIGTINDSGFGIIDSNISTQFNGQVGSITAGGYGIRNSFIGGGSSIGSINITGNGSNLATTSLTPSVRESQTQTVNPSFNVAFDPFSGRSLTMEDDIDAYLGTSSTTPVIQGVTDTGVLEDSIIQGSYKLGSLVAQTIRSRELDSTNDPTDVDSPSSSDFVNRIEMGSIGTLQTRGLIDGLRVVSGSIQKFEPGSDVLALFLQTSGKIKTLTIKGSLAGNSTINASGTNGGIGSIKIAHDLTGSINVTNNVSSISIGGNLTGSLTINGTTKGNALGKLFIGGSLVNGSLNVTGNVGTIQTAGSLGTAGNSLSFTGNLQKLIVGSGNLNANLTVAGKVGTVQVNGAIDGTITTGTVNGNFNSLIVNGPINGAITINGKLNNAKVNNGNVNATVNAVDGINKFLVLNGSLSVGDSIESTSGSIGTLTISGGDLFGSVQAPTGSIKTISVSNNLGDGIDPLTIAAGSLNTLNVGGSILSGVTVNITGPLGALIVGGSIEPGVSISAASHRTLVVGGSIAPGALHIG